MDNRLVGMRTLRQHKIVHEGSKALICRHLLALILLLPIGCTDTKAEISDADGERISYFFRHAIFWDAYGYVLLGKKPCAITSYKQITWNPLTWIEYFSPHNLKMRKGWITWKKYEHLFSHPRFLFLEEDSNFTSAHFIILVHKDIFLKKFNEYRDDFHDLLGIDEGEEFLFRAVRQPFLSQVLKNHDGLIGTMLGYGRNNAWAFYQQSDQLTLFLNENEQLQMKQFCKSQPFWKFFMGTYSREFCHLTVPGFHAIPNTPETRYLREIYSECRDKIVDCYSETDFLTKTLELLSL